MLKTEELKLVSEWDKTFPQSEKVDHKKVTFVNRYGITLAYENMIKDSKYTSNKELLTIPGAVHTDLYDNLDVIPFDKIQKFFKENGVG